MAWWNRCVVGSGWMAQELSTFLDVFCSHSDDICFSEDVERETVEDLIICRIVSSCGDGFKEFCFVGYNAK
jgi:hypothetical protein